MNYKKLIHCEECEADFTIGHDLDENSYVLKHCVFCGEELEEECEDDFGDDSDEW